jgi:hypothetical protein
MKQAHLFTGTPVRKHVAAEKRSHGTQQNQKSQIPHRAGMLASRHQGAKP